MKATNESILEFPTNKFNFIQKNKGYFSNKNIDGFFKAKIYLPLLVYNGNIASDINAVISNYIRDIKDSLVKVIKLENLDIRVQIDNFSYEEDLKYSEHLMDAETIFTSKYVTCFGRSISSSVCKIDKDEGKGKIKNYGIILLRLSGFINIVSNYCSSSKYVYFDKVNHHYNLEYIVKLVVRKIYMEVFDNVNCKSNNANHLDIFKNIDLFWIKKITIILNESSIEEKKD